MIQTLERVNVSFTYHDTEITLEVPHILSPFATRQQKGFLAYLDTTLGDDTPSVVSKVEAACLFISYLCINSQPREPRDQRDQLVASQWQHLESTLLGQEDIHSFAAAAEASTTARRRVIRSYYNAQCAAASSTRPAPSALLQAQAAGQARLFGVFGGQGNNKRYFEELREVHDTYGSFTRGLVESLSATLLALSRDPRVAEQFPEGLDVARWLEDAGTTPSADYLITAPLSFPLIGMLQLARYKAICMSHSGTISDPSEMFQVLSGHSQGTVVAAAIATATTWAEFAVAATKAVTILFWIGARAQQLFEAEDIPDSLVAKSVEDGHGSPSPMLSVSNITRGQLQAAIAKLNKALPKSHHVHTALVNTASHFVVSGRERALLALTTALKAGAAKESQAQTRVPFSKRKPATAIRFLPITIPCHSSLLAEAVPLIEADLRDISLDSGALRRSGRCVFQTCHMESMSEEGDLVPALVRMVTVDLVNWPEVALGRATHIVDFGPGGVGGVGLLTQRNVQGAGARVIVSDKLDPNDGSDLGAVTELFSAKPVATHWAANWAEAERVGLAETAAGVMVTSKMTRILGLPPVMVAGMTPTTVHPEFVAAVMHAGYHVEFAAGGYHSPPDLEAALYKLRDLTPAGRSITINLIYASPKAMAWQVPLIRQMRSEGFPVTGITIGAGVPSLQIATEYIETLGLEQISFKPGSTLAIQEVVRIAKQHPKFPIILQWTGGRGGGHHSAEDFHAPMLETYGDIRSCANIALVAGSGFGSSRDVVDYFTGAWSEAFGRARMPFDGVLVGSRVMTCAEAFTSSGAKEAIARTVGVEDRDWEGTYDARVGAGGIISVLSEMGEPIHVVSTRGARFWAEMDATVFSVDRKKRVEILQARREHIISRLNADYQRPWFGTKPKGQTCELSQLTYAEVAERLVELLFGTSRRAWVDKSHLQLFIDFLFRIEQRFSTDSESYIPEDKCLTDPSGVLQALLWATPAAVTSLLYAEDVQYFLQLCRKPGTKPVPFIPALDENFETYFKKDSLWQSENLESVIDGDAERTFILHGPVAARHTCKVNEPVAEVLNEIKNGVTEHILAEHYGRNVSSLPREEFLTRARRTSEEAQTTNDGVITAQSLKPSEVVHASVMATNPSWSSALFGSRYVARGKDLVRNPLEKIFDVGRIHRGMVQDHAISLYSKSSDGAEQLVLQVNKYGNNLRVLAFTHVTEANNPVAMVMSFEYHPEASFCPIWETPGGRNERIGAMYRQLWQKATPLEGAQSALSSSPSTAVFEDKFTVTRARVDAFNRATSPGKPRNLGKVSMDFAIVVGWSSICKALLQDPIQGDVLNLVHLSNAFEAQGDFEATAPGQVLKSSARVEAITIEGSGKVVEVACDIRREEEAIALSPSPVLMTVRSRFLFRGVYEDFASTFARRKHAPYVVKLRSEDDISVLGEKAWFHLEDKGKLLDDLNLTELTTEFQVQTMTRWQSRTAYASVETRGKAYVVSEAGDRVEVGKIQHSSRGSQHNEVLSYLKRRGRVADTHQHRERLGAAGTEAPVAHRLRITVPGSNEAYSRASGDFNPIHTSPLFAELAGLPEPITHGMYVSAAVRQAAERQYGGPGRIRTYDVSFVGMVRPGDGLEVTLRHTGMQAGLKHVEVEARRLLPNGETEKVLAGTALVAQPPTTFVFTGQGSQTRGMGMALYAASAEARAVWDRADAYFMRQFGVSLLAIVRDNPRELRVHFGGARGRMLRQNYMALHHELPPATPGGPPVRRPAFPGLNERSASYTHSAPEGLLFATQFAQPAMTALALAAFRDLRARSVVEESACRFAGHSLGEYAALSAVADIMALEDLLYVVFCRGLAMQGAVERDAQGRSAFSMVAVDPSRICQGFTEKQLKGLVAQLQSQTGLFVEIVNFNLRDGQYVCAGDLRALELLQRVCDDAARAAKTSKAGGGAAAAAALLDHGALARLIAHQQRQQQSGPSQAAALVRLRRGVATVPLAGVDVPFHSSFLRPRMDAFRRVLQDTLDADRLRPDRLINRYIPNVTGLPFDITRDYFERVESTTGSTNLRAILDGWEDWMVRVERERVEMASSGEVEVVCA